MNLATPKGVRDVRGRDGYNELSTELATFLFKDGQMTDLIDLVCSYTLSVVTWSQPLRCDMWTFYQSTRPVHELSTTGIRVLTESDLRSQITLNRDLRPLSNRGSIQDPWWSDNDSVGVLLTGVDSDGKHRYIRRKYPQSQDINGDPPDALVSNHAISLWVDTQRSQFTVSQSTARCPTDITSVASHLPIVHTKMFENQAFLVQDVDRLGQHHTDLPRHGASLVQELDRAKVTDSRANLPQDRFLTVGFVRNDFSGELEGVLNAIFSITEIAANEMPAETKIPDLLEIGELVLYGTHYYRVKERTESTDDISTTDGLVLSELDRDGRTLNRTLTVPAIDMPVFLNGLYRVDYFDF